MDDQAQEYRELVELYRKQLDLNRNFGVEFVPRSAAPATPPGGTPPPERPPKGHPQRPRREGSASRARRNRSVPHSPYERTGMQIPLEIPPAPEIPPNDVFEELRDVVASCKKCELCKNRMFTVFGEGDPTTDVVFVGEGPGVDEDRTGRPFVGRAGALLTKIIQNGMKLPRHSVYIANIVKCRPPDNRAPTISEMAVCRPYLVEQLRTIRPKVIVAMGATACHGLLGRKVSITQFRGKFQEWEGVKVMPTFHPAYLCRNYTREARAAVWEDAKAVMRYLKEVDSPLVGKK